MLVIFKSGSSKDKSRYLFKMYDTDGDSILSKAELQNMIKSLVEASSTADSKVEDSRVVSQIVGSLGSDRVNYLYSSKTI